MKISCGKNKGKLFKVWQKHEAAWAGQAYSALSNRCDCDLFVSWFVMQESEVQVDAHSDTAHCLHKNEPALKVVCTQSVSDISFEQALGINWRRICWTSCICAAELTGKPSLLQSTNFKTSMGKFWKQRCFIHGAAANHLHQFYFPKYLIHLKICLLKTKMKSIYIHTHTFLTP